LQKDWHVNARSGLFVVALIGLLAFGSGVNFAAEEESTAEAPSAEKTKADDHKSGSADLDLSHGNGTAELTSPSAFKFDLSVATFVVFALLMLLLGKFAWGPISQGLDKREQGIATMIADAERNAKEAEKRLQELEARLAAQAEEARQALSAARREGEVIKEKLVGEAHDAAQQEKDRALAEIRSAKNAALREISQKSVNLAVDLAKNLIHREVRPDDHAALINDSLTQFGNN
jgi:F-type H+-transporting ATPase subunit b